MIALTITINGRPLSTAGREDMSVLNAIVNAIGKLGVDSSGAKGHENDFYLELRVGGLTSRDDHSSDEHLGWDVKDLKIGDEILIKVTETKDVDPPKSVKPAMREDSQKKYFEWAKKFYLENREKYENEDS